MFGDSLTGNPGYPHRVTGMGAAGHLPPITATAMDVNNNVYWTDSIGALRMLNATT